MKYKESGPQETPADNAVAVVIEALENNVTEVEKAPKNDNIEETYKDIIMMRLSLIKDSVEIVEKTLKKLYKIPNEADD